MTLESKIKNERSFYYTSKQKIKNNYNNKTNTMSSECPICLDYIDNNNDKIRTKCNHEFHSSCFLANVAHNGFNCPCCREKLAEIPDTDDESESDNSSYSGSDSGSETGYDYIASIERAIEHQRQMLPDTEYILQKLNDINYTSLDLLKIIMHNSYIFCKNSNCEENNNISLQLDDDIRIIINEYEDMKQEQNLMQLEDKIQ